MCHSLLILHARIERKMCWIAMHLLKSWSRHITAWFIDAHAMWLGLASSLHHKVHNVTHTSYPCCAFTLIHFKLCDQCHWMHYYANEVAMICLFHFCIFHSQKWTFFPLNYHHCKIFHVLDKSSINIGLWTINNRHL